jgi:hypothetical protein
MADVTFEDCLGNININSDVDVSNENTKIRVINNNRTENFDFIRLKTGMISRTGASLADTTSRSGFAIKFQ